MKSTNYYNYDPNRAAVLPQKKCGSKEPEKRCMPKRWTGGMQGEMSDQVDSEKFVRKGIRQKIYQGEMCVHTNSSAINKEMASYSISRYRR